MLNKFSISRSATNKLEAEFTRTGLRPNILARNAFMASLEKDDFFDSDHSVDMSGKEFNSYTLWGDHFQLYMTLVKQKYRMHNNVESFLPQIVAWHVDKGIS